MALLLLDRGPALMQGAGAEQQLIGGPQAGFELRQGGAHIAVPFGRHAAAVVGQRRWAMLWIEEQVIEIKQHGDALPARLGDQAEQLLTGGQAMDQQAIHAVQQRRDGVEGSELLEGEDGGLTSQLEQLLALLLHAVEPALRQVVVGAEQPAQPGAWAQRQPGRQCFEPRLADLLVEGLSLALQLFGWMQHHMGTQAIEIPLCTGGLCSALFQPE